MGGRIFRSVQLGLRDESLPMRLYEKSKRLGVWNPSDIDLERDRADWQGLDRRQRQQILYFNASFLGGEESVTNDLLPMVFAIARAGMLEEELYLTAFLFEEGKHMQFFRRWLDEVAGSPQNLELLHFPSWKRMFHVEVPATMDRLLTDHSAEALARAAVTYNILAEGVLAGTGYHAYHEAIAAHGLMPGLCEGLTHIKLDESRHIAFGVHLLSRLIADDPAIWPAIEDRMVEVYAIVRGITTEGFRLSPGGRTAFGLEQERFEDYADRQYRLRRDRLRRVYEDALAGRAPALEADDVDDLVQTS